MVVGIDYKRCKRIKPPLDYAERDAKVVASTLRRFGKNYSLEGFPSIGNSVQRCTVEGHVRKGINIFHFSGHGKMQGRSSEISLGCGDKLRAKELLETCSRAEIPAPTFSFINACETALQKPSRWEVYDWARAMADQGGRACIGTLWSVRDKESTQFSVEFYKNLFLKRKTLGESVRQAKLKVKKGGKDAILTWPAFVLYGPPTLRTSDILI